MEANQSHYWYPNSPASGVNHDNFSVRWTGYLYPPVTGNYTFYFRPDDVAQVWVNDSLILNRPSPCCQEYASSPVSLTAGQKVTFRAELVENSGGAGLKSSWSYPGQAKTTIPNWAFSTY